MPSPLFMMNPRILVAAALLLSTASAAEFRGRLSPAVEPGTRALSAVVPAPPTLIASLPAAPADDAKVWSLSRPLNIKGKPYALLIVATATGEKTLWLDRDADGKFGDNEHWSFSAEKKSVSLSLPWANGIYQEFPITFEWSNEPLRRAPQSGGGATLTVPTAPSAPTLVTSLVYNFNILYTGSVEVDGKPLRVMIAPKPADIAIDLANQRTSLDANFNGEFEPTRGEAENPTGKIPVFRSGDRYLAIKTADLATGDLVIEERPASDYTRFEAAPGQTMPDFAFTDFTGAHHRLSDYRGKYVLLDFWGTWCGPCIEEMRHMDPLYAKYHPRGFEIIGMNVEKTSGRLTPEDYVTVTEKARAFIAKAGHQWLQATQESIERVALDVIHVNLYPTCILIGPDGKILSREARGETLESLLAQHLPASS